MSDLNRIIETALSGKLVVLGGHRSGLLVLRRKLYHELDKRGISDVTMTMKNRQFGWQLRVFRRSVLENQIREIYK